MTLGLQMTPDPALANLRYQTLCNAIYFGESRRPFIRLANSDYRLICEFGSAMRYSELSLRSAVLASLGSTIGGIADRIAKKQTLRITAWRVVAMMQNMGRAGIAFRQLVSDSMGTITPILPVKSAVAFTVPSTRPRPTAVRSSAHIDLAPKGIWHRWGVVLVGSHEAAR